MNNNEAIYFKSISQVSVEMFKSLFAHSKAAAGTKMFPVPFESLKRVRHWTLTAAESAFKMKLQQTKHSFFAMHLTETVI